MHVLCGLIGESVGAELELWKYYMFETYQSLDFLIKSDKKIWSFAFYINSFCMDDNLYI